MQATQPIPIFRTTLAGLFFIVPCCSNLPNDVRVSSATPGGSARSAIRDSTFLPAKATVWSGKVHRSRFPVGQASVPRVIIDRRTWVRTWRVLHDTMPVPVVNFREYFLLIDSHDSNERYPPSPNPVVRNPGGEFAIMDIYMPILHPPSRPAKTLDFRISLHSRAGVASFPDKYVRPGKR